MEGLKCILTVKAGVIPEQPDEEVTRQWLLSSSDTQDHHKYLDAMGAAMNYAHFLANPQMFNWVHFEWIWV